MGTFNKKSHSAIDMVFSDPIPLLGLRHHDYILISFRIAVGVGELTVIIE